MCLCVCVCVNPFKILNRKKPSKLLPVGDFTLQRMNWNGIGKRASVTPVNLFSSGEPAVVPDTEEASTDQRPCTPQLSTSSPARGTWESSTEGKRKQKRKKNEVLEFLMEDCGFKKKKRQQSSKNATRLTSGILRESSLAV